MIRQWPSYRECRRAMIGGVNIPLDRLGHPLLSIAIALFLSAMVQVTAQAQNVTVQGGSSLPPGMLDSIMNGMFSGGNGMFSNVVVMGENGDTLQKSGKLGDLKSMLQRLMKQHPGFSNGAMGTPNSMVDYGKLILSPSIIPVNAKSQTAVLHLTNPNNDSVPLDFVVQSANPRSSPFAILGTTAKQDTAGEKWSLAGWVKDVPQGIVLAPHESRTVTLHVAVPEHVAAGKYSAYVLVYFQKPITINASTDLSQGLDPLSDTTAHGFPKNSYALGKLVYVQRTGSSAKKGD